MAESLGLSSQLIAEKDTFLLYFFFHMPLVLQMKVLCCNFTNPSGFNNGNKL